MEVDKRKWAAQIAALTPEQKAAWKEWLLSQQPIWQPLPGPQTAALHTQADYLFYGGAAGGGKSDLLLGLGITRHRKSIIFRREYPQFRDLIFRSQELLGGVKGVRFNGQSMIWRGLPGDRILEFGAVAHDGDLGRYKGRPHDLKAFDEVSDFTENQFRFLTGWARTTHPGQRVRIVAAGNPPTTAEGEWVVRFWAPWLDDQYPRPAAPGELRWFTYVDNQDIEVEGPEPFEHKGEVITPKSRTFLPARVTDNMFLLASGYLSQLQSLPEPLRSQLIFGDFGMKLDDDPWQVIPTAWVLAAQKRWREVKERGDDVGPLSCLGVDVARGGKDKTCIAARYSTFVDEVETYPGASTPDGPAVATLVAQALALRGGLNSSTVRLHIDVIGVGASVYDILKVAQPYYTWGVNFAEAPFSPLYDKSERLRLPNYRSVAYWKLREMLDPATGDNLALPDDRELRADLCAPRWSLRPGGIVIEDKEHVSARLGRSPDKGDAVALSLLTPPITGPVVSTQNPFYE